MSSSNIAAPNPAGRSRPSGVESPLMALIIGVLSVGVLCILRVFDWTVLIVEGLPRAEILGATLGALGFAAVALPRSNQADWKPTLSIALLPPLAAVAYLGLEATSLVLCPRTFEFGVLSTPIEFGPAASLAATEWLTAFVACLLATSFTLVLATSMTPEARQRALVSVASVAIVTGVLLLLVPVPGPALGVLPLPARLDPTLAAAPAVARTGFVCLPAVLALTLIWIFRRDGDRSPRSGRPIWWVTLGSGTLVIGIELSCGRYSPLSIGMAGGIVAMVLLIERVITQILSHAAGVFARPSPSSSHSDAPATLSDPRERVRRLLTAVFFFSGMAALVYQVVFAKGLALTFGSTSHASTIVLATYMGGLALGSWMGGRWAARLMRPVLGYALAELGIAGICAVAPYTLKAARAAYVAIAAGADPSEPWLVGLQLGLGALVLVPPTWLMGLTLPLLTRQFLDEKSTLGASAGLLYTANTLGAALGATLTGYLVLPTLGISRTLLVAVATNVAVAFFAIAASRVGRSERTSLMAAEPDARDAARSGQSTPSGGPTTSMTAADQVEATALRVGWIATLQLTIGGFVTFGLETTFVHLLATVAGTSTYAFSLMLFAFLIGLSLGASQGRRWLPKQRHLPLALLGCQLVLALTLLVASKFWDYLPLYFAEFGRWPYTLTFAAREFVRFIVCLAVMLPPAICIGAQFPIAMEAVGFGWPDARVQALGRASALNTLGNILGALVVGFVALPRLGSHRTLGALTLVCLLLAAMALFIVERRQRFSACVAVAAALGVLLVQPPEFDLTRLASGGNVYFKPQYYGRVIDHAESLDGGLTTVAINYERSGHPIKTLLTNGKFQGNDRRDSSGEMVAQSSFAIAPLLHTTARDAALVIGFGTGTTTRVLNEAGFQRVDVAELSGDIVRLADRHFSAINQGVIHRPNVKLHVTDGRNFLLLDRHRYDLISIELSSIWFAGAANLYNEEFYGLVEPRLSERGILQQWVQLHRLSHRDVISALVTLRQRFPRVWLYFLGKQGILVACKSDCMPSLGAVRRLQDTPRLAPTLALFGDGLFDVLRGRLLTPDGVDRLIDDYRNSVGAPLATLISNDDNLYLEYSTPRGNVREYDESLDDNVAFLSRFRAPNPFDGTVLQLSALN